MENKIQIQPPPFLIKSIIYETIGKTGGYQILVYQNIDENGTPGRNLLGKSGFSLDGKRRKDKGFTLPDLLIIKTNWGKILKAMGE